MKLFVGRSDYRGQIRRYDLDLLEVPVEPKMPKPATLRKMREQRPELRFSLRLAPDVLSGLSASGEHADLDRAREAAEILGASAVVLASGPRFTPTKANKRRLELAARALRKADHHLAWEPRGVWSDEEAEQWSEDLDLLLVRDLSRQHPVEGTTHYTRLLPLGVNARLGASAVERLADHLEEAEEAYVVVDGSFGTAMKKQLHQLFDESDEGAEP